MCATFCEGFVAMPIFPMAIIQCGLFLCAQFSVLGYNVCALFCVRYFRCGSRQDNKTCSYYAANIMTD